MVQVFNNPDKLLEQTEKFLELLKYLQNIKVIDLEEHPYKKTEKQNIYKHDKNNKPIPFTQFYLLIEQFTKFKIVDIDLEGFIKRGYKPHEQYIMEQTLELEKKKYAEEAKSRKLSLWIAIIVGAASIIIGCFTAWLNYQTSQSIQKVNIENTNLFPDTTKVQITQAPNDTTFFKFTKSKKETTLVKIIPSPSLPKPQK